MPFAIKGKYVINTVTGQRKNKKPMGRPALLRYLAALNMHATGDVKK